jgi:adenine/guanine phosphoribosyltransferase-like PRPP-binding protein
MRSGTHYSFGQRPELMHEWARDTAKLVRKFARSKKTKSVVLCYTGMSGISHAVALSLALYRLPKSKLEVGMVYVRKDNETSHGREVEVSEGITENDVFIFVDDFVASGSTYRNVKVGLATVCPDAKISAMAVAKHLFYEDTNSLAESESLTVLMP